MKNFKYLIILSIGVLFSSCDQNNYKVYDTVSYLQFGVNDTLKNTTFFYDEETKIKDTIYFDLYPIGGPKNYDRPIKIEQIKLDGVENAIPGVHYKGFDSPDMAKLYVMPKDSVHLAFPVIILRDKSLKDKEVTLKFEIKENKEFRTGQRNRLWRKLVFTDALQRPSDWDASAVRYFWGEYSVTKHLWMIELTNEKWDQTFMENLNDYAYQTFLRNFFISELAKKNNELEQELKDHFKDENENYILFPGA